MSLRAIATLIGMIVGLFTIASTVAAVTWFVVDLRVAPLERNVTAFRAETIGQFNKYDARLTQLEATVRRLGEAVAEMKGTFEAFVGILRESVGFDAPASSAPPDEGHVHQHAALEVPCMHADNRSSAVSAP